jgi:CBS domain containing-hemolysin-like protein
VNPDVIGLLLLALLLVINAYFVGAEFAVISARRSQIEPRADQGSPAARTTLWAMEHATLMLATTQLGITVCSLLILNVSEPAIHHLLSHPLSAMGLGASVIKAATFVIALLVVTFLHVVVGEMVPKNLSFSRPGRAALLLTPPLVFLGRLVRPVIVALNAAANGFVRLLRIQPKDEAASAFTLEEVATIVQQSQEAGTIADASGQLTAALEFAAKSVADLVVPINQVIMLSPGPTPAQIQQLVADHGYSRYPVAGLHGVPTGYLHLKDVLDLDSADQWHAAVPSDRLHRVDTLPPSSDAEDALHAMRSTNTHLALSVDAAGNVVGVLFLEDVLEELVGQIEDSTNTG